MEISIPKDAEAYVLSQATAAGFLNAEEYILDLLNINSPLATVSEVPRDQWLRNFDALVANQQSRNPHVDARRESIYPVR